MKFQSQVILCSKPWSSTVQNPDVELKDIDTHISLRSSSISHRGNLLIEDTCSLSIQKQFSPRVGNASEIS